MEISIRLADQQVENDSKLLDDLIDIRAEKHPDSAVFADKIGVTEDELLDFESFPLDYDMPFVRRYSHALGIVVTHSIALCRNDSPWNADCWKSPVSMKKASEAYLEEGR